LATETHRRPLQSPDFIRLTNQLVQVDVLCSIFVPWLLLASQETIRHCAKLPVGGTVAHLLAPHLYFYQVQIAAEALLIATRQEYWVFPYTCVAAFLRGFPLGTWLWRSLSVVTSIAQEPPSPYHNNLCWWLLVAGLPAACSTLWLYFVLVFIPLRWYPLARGDDKWGRDGSLTPLSENSSLREK
jgi:hypothetical protein